MDKVKRIAITGATAGLFLSSAAGVFAVAPGAQIKNENANSNACWGQDRAFYADGSAFKDAGGNMDIKRSFPPTSGGVGEQRAAWVATYCAEHGPVAE